MRTQRAFITALITLALFAGACGNQKDGGATAGGDSIAGTYNCQNVNRVEVWELREDGTLAIDAPRGPEGTWSAEGDTLVVTIEGQEDTFTIEGDRFVAAGEPAPGLPPGFRFACTPA